MIRRRRLLWFIVAAVPLGLGGTPYRWQRSIALPSADAGWVVLDLPGDVLAAARPGFPDLRVASGDDEVPYALEARLRPVEESVSLRDVESVPGRDTTAIVDRGARPRASGSIAIELEGSDPFLKPVTVEASDDRASWREISRGSVFRTGAASMTTLRFAPNDRRYWRLTLDDRNGAVVRPLSVVVESPVETSPPRPLELPAPRASKDSASSSIYTVSLPSENLPLVALEVGARDPAFERSVRVFERVFFRDEVQRRLVGAGTIWRLADGRGSSSIALGDVSSRALEVEVSGGDSPPLDVSGVTAQIAPKRIVFFAPANAALSLRYGSQAAPAPHYDLSAVLTKGRPASLREAHLGPAVDLGAPPPELLPAPRGVALETSRWPIKRPIALPPRGPVAYLDLEPEETEGVRIVDADGHQVPYVFEERDRRVRRDVVLQMRESGQTTELTITGPGPGPGPGPGADRADALELTATAPSYFERQVVASQATFDPRGETGRRVLGTGTWEKRPDQPFAPFRLELEAHEGAGFLVSIDNGDNPHLVLGPAAVEIPLRRVDFAFQPGDKLTLLTGNPSAGSPRYDLALLEDAVLASPAEAASAGPATAPPLAPAALPRWFWAAATLAGGFLVLVMLRTLKGDPVGPDERSA